MLSRVIPNPICYFLLVSSNYSLVVLFEFAN